MMRATTVPETRRSTSVVVHYGDLEPTVRLANHLADFDTDVVVVANDRSPRPESLPERVEWIVPGRNLGYGEAFMTAVRGRSTEALVLLNNDIALPRETFERCLDTLLAAGDIGVVGPVLRHDDDSLQSGAARLTRWRRVPRVLVDPGPVTVECTWVTGAVMFIRREVAQQVGMDGSFFLGAEDADLCIRARRAGWRILCCGDAVATHHGSRVIGARWNYYSTRNRVWYTRACFGLGPALLNWVCAAATLPRVALADLVKRGDMTASRLSLLALAHAWRRKPAADEGPLAGEPFPDRLIGSRRPIGAQQVVVHVGEPAQRDR
ncbi:MAG TPA: glycosyltransferase family 2 protein [Rugosimonospora sp.]